MTALNDQSIRKFNPGLFQPDKELIEQFVVRNRELEMVLDVLHGNLDSQSCQHVLVIARRGMGKTMLLARIAAELRSCNGPFRHLLPVRFMEESHEVYSVADFWLEALFHLEREIAADDPEFSQELRKTRADLKSRWREREIAARARAAVIEAAEYLDRRLVLMVENFQSLCRSVDQDFSWGLRKALQTEPRIMLLATATRRIEALEDARHPFFELFRDFKLNPLDKEECQRLWRSISEDGKSDEEIRALHILTGGSPRLLVIVAGFARHRSLRRLLEELVTLIDEHTEYFRGHLEDLPTKERRVYLAVADLWRPAPAGDIAARADMDIRVVSAMLGRLVHRGAVSVEAEGRTRTYATAERLYCIYYKLRRERDTASAVQNLIYFMAAFYGRDEFAEMPGVLRAEAMQHEIIRGGIERALKEASCIHEMFSGQEFPNSVLSPDIAKTGGIDAEVLMSEAQAHEGRREFKAAIAKYDQVIECFGDHGAPEIQRLIFVAMLKKVIAQDWLGDAAAIISSCDQLIERFGGGDDPETRLHIALVMVIKGSLQATLGDFEAAFSTYDQVVKLFGDDDTEIIQTIVVLTMYQKGMAQIKFGRSEDALEAFRLACRAAVPRNRATMDSMIETVQALIAGGISERRLIELLTEDDHTADALEPLVVALRQRAGESVRAPGEVLEIAADIHKRMAAHAPSVPKQRLVSS